MKMKVSYYRMFDMTSARAAATASSTVLMGLALGFSLNLPSVPRPMGRDARANACFAFVGGLLNKSTGNTINVDGGVSAAFLR
jgi:hypothetical protein